MALLESKETEESQGPKVLPVRRVPLDLLVPLERPAQREPMESPVTTVAMDRMEQEEKLYVAGVHAT